MRNLRSTSLVAALFSAMVGASILLACTHDFDSYEPGDGTGEGGATTTDGQAGTDAKTNPGTDGSADGAPKDAAPPVDCKTKASCGTTQTSCTTTCEQTRTTCEAACPNGGPGNKCRNNCGDARDTCVSNCRSTCRSCAGAGCGSVCP